MDRIEYEKRLSDIRFKSECIRNEASCISYDSRDNPTIKAIDRLKVLNDILIDLHKQAEAVQDAYEISHISSIRGKM